MYPANNRSILIDKGNTHNRKKRINFGWHICEFHTNASISLLALAQWSNLTREIHLQFTHSLHSLSAWISRFRIRAGSDGTNWIACYEDNLVHSPRISALTLTKNNNKPLFVHTEYHGTTSQVTVHNALTTTRYLSGAWRCECHQKHICKLVRRRHLTRNKIKRKKSKW